MKKFKYLPDMSKFPDCEEKRRVINLAQKLEIQLKKYTSENREKLEQIHEESNEIYWEINATMGALVAKKVDQTKHSQMWRVSLIISISALILSTISIFAK